MLKCHLHRMKIAACQKFIFLTSATIPNWTHSMYHIITWQIICFCNLCLTCLTTMKIPTRPHTIVFGQRNHERLPRRNKRTMPRVSASGKMAAIKNVGSPDWHIMTAQPKTTSATYVHPRASTILTGSGFFISGTVYQKSVRSRARK